MSQMMLQRSRFELQKCLGIIVPLECAICKRGINDGIAITASNVDTRIMLCDLHISKPARVF